VTSQRADSSCRRRQPGRELQNALECRSVVVHRYYDPVTAQFVSVDPALGVTGQPYAYAGGDPVNGVDPLGLSFWSDVGKVAGAVAIGAAVVGVGVATLGVGDVAILGAVSAASAVDAVGLTAGVVSTGVDCAESNWSLKCGLDAGSLGFAGGSLAAEKLSWQAKYFYGASGLSALFGGASMLSRSNSVDYCLGQPQ